MRKIVYTICIVLFSSYFFGQTSLDFTIHVVSSTNSITCSNSAVNCVIRTNATESVSYSWVGQLASFTGYSVSINMPGTYTVYGTTTSGQGQSKTINIGINMVSPISSVNPIVQSISCNSASLAQVMASSVGSGTSLSHYFLSPFGGSYVANTPTTSYIPSVPGIYTHQLINNDNGCVTTKTFTVNSSSGFPTFNVSSLSSFTLGCGNTSTTSISIDHGNTSPVPGGPVSYTILSPSSSTNVINGSLSPNNTYTINSPGNYTLITRDNTSLCETRVPVSVIQNTTAPDLSIYAPTQVLDCNKNKVKIEALSSAANISYNWAWQGSSGGTSTDESVSVITNTSQPLNPIVNTYTVVATSSYNQCSTASLITIYQSLFEPNPVISYPSNKLTCSNPTLILTNQSSSSIPPSSGLPDNLPVVPFWKGPLSQNITQSTTYNAPISGYYKLQALDLNNGCKSSTTIAVFDERVYPMVNNPFVPAPFCINTITTSVFIYPIITEDTKDFTYHWFGPPGSALTPPNSFSYSANALGIYTVIVTNTVNSCSSMAQVIVANCYTGISENAINGSGVFAYPNPTNGLVTLSNLDYEDNILVKVYNTLGMKVAEQTLDADNKTLDLSTQAYGVYTLYIFQKNKNTASIKLIKN